MKILNVAIVFCVGVLGFLLLSVSRNGSVKDDSVLIVGTSPDYPPYEFVDMATGQIIGFDIDVVTEVAARLNKKIVIKEMSFASLIFGLLSGDIDLIAAGMSPTPRRAKFVSFSEKYLDSDLYVIVTLKDHFQPKSLQELKNKDVVVNTGYTAEAYLDQQDIGIRLTRLRTPAEALIALQSGSVDAFVCALSTAQAMITRIGIADNFYLLELPNTGDDCAFALSKQAEALTKKINKALASMHADGTLDCLKEKWKLL